MNAVQKQCRYFVVIHTPFEVAMGGRVILKKYIFYQCTCTNTFMHTNIVEKNLRSFSAPKNIMLHDEKITHISRGKIPSVW